MSGYNFSNKEKVVFSTAGYSGYGEVVGVSLTLLSVSGPYYMVKIIHTDSPELIAHPFDTIVVPEDDMVSINLSTVLVRLQNGDSAYNLYIKDDPTPVLQVNFDFLTPLRSMSEPERTMLANKWVDNVIATTPDLLTKISEPFFRIFIKHLINQEKRTR